MRIRQSILNLGTIRRLQQELVRRKIPDAQSSADIIVQQFLKYNNINNGQEGNRVKGGVVQKIIRALRLRCYHYPVQYIVPFWYFRFLTIKIGPPLLVPRFETEYFVSLMLQKITKKWPKGSHLRMVDFCCGTGVIGLSLLQQLRQVYEVEMVFLDLSAKATRYTKKNCELNTIPEESYQIIQGNLLDHLQIIKQCQVVVSNPPYIPQRKYRKLQKQIRLFQDKAALISGQEGMDLIQPLISAINSQIKSRSDLIAGIEYDGQSVEHLNLQLYVYPDQYGKRRYLIFQ